MAGGSEGASDPGEATEAGPVAAEAAAGELLRIGPGVGVPLRDLTWRFSTAGGPGGQHVNTSNTRAEVTLVVSEVAGVPDWVRARWIERLGAVVSVAAGDTRSQARNRQLALTRLAARLAAALETARPRRPTRPSRASQRRRVETKRRRGQLKRQRREGDHGVE